VTSPPHSRLEALLRARQFVVTAELQTNDGADADAVRAGAAGLVGIVDAANVTDNSAAHAHLSPVATAHLAADVGLEPIVQLTCRDRNRLALQADLLGAAALGGRNILALTGDDVSAGDHPETRPIFDIDSLHLLRIARIMRDEGTYLSGRKLTSPPTFFVGGAENPFAPPHDIRARRLATKVDAGAEFAQLQLCFNVPRLRAFMAEAAEIGVLDRCFVLVSIYVARSVRAIRYLRDVVPGIDVPDEVMARFEAVADAPRERQAEEGITFALETIEAVREIPGISGVHLISIRGQGEIRRVVERAGLLPRPTSSHEPTPVVG
jgi:methylenetetrahydrofolate reductase (NADPH)